MLRMRGGIMKKHWWLRLHEKNGKLNEMPCHHKREEYLGCLRQRCRHRGRPQGPLFCSANRQNGSTLRKVDAARGCLARGARRASDAGIETATGCHTFRATGITDYLTNGGRIEVAQRMAGHSNAKPPGFMTGATMTSAWARSSGSGFEKRQDAGLFMASIVVSENS